MLPNNKIYTSSSAKCTISRRVPAAQESPVYTFPSEAHDNPLEFYGIWPGEQVGLGSPEPLLTAARNTVLLADVTQPLQMNSFQEIFPAFVRAGCAEGCDLNASYILRTLAGVVTTQMGANGYLRQGGGGIETAGGAVCRGRFNHIWLT